MKICIFANCAFLSETSRMIAVYQELKSRGVATVMATHGGPYEQILIEENIPYQIVKPYITAERAHQFVKTNTGENGMTEFYTPEELKQHVEEEIAFYQQEKFTTILTGLTLSCSISARVLEIPLVVTHLGSFVPPVFERRILEPILAAKSRLLNFIPSPWLITWVNKLVYRSKAGTKSFNKVAKSYGIKPFNSITEVMMGDIVIVTDVPEILGITKEELENWSPSAKDKRFYSYDYKLKYGGAIFAKLFGDIPSNVLSFLKTDLPKIYVAMTSGPPDLLNKVYTAVKDLPVRTVLCSTVHKFKSQAHPSILVADYLPSHKIMPLVDLAIIHGGQGSVQTAIESGTPIIGIPLNLEQGLNVTIVERNGAGLVQNKHEVTPDEIREKIKTIQSYKFYKENILKLSAYQKSVDGVKKAADILLNTPAILTKK